eukprot:CAMPEP_0175110880 /NCGR_PEP_ID=MMETSP0086_2-20121207/14397_1 /TAXON_ID=136419 /ORGANISM="Unknown Unknown, Strain D1" /LENGTH=61 /DNA_ID=CAMNT_0016389169 /DNA_START=74 /DNA_END=256 /DNA_ORIENTATION=-
MPLVCHVREQLGGWGPTADAGNECGEAVRDSASGFGVAAGFSVVADFGAAESGKRGEEKLD